MTTCMIVMVALGVGCIALMWAGFSLLDDRNRLRKREADLAKQVERYRSLATYEEWRRKKHVQD